MPFSAKVKSLLRNLISSRRVEVELDDEVRAHLELLIDENIRAGMAPDAALRIARIELGGVEQVKEQIREQRIGNWLRSVISDCQYGVRQLRKNPGFTVIAVLTLALGIAVNTTMFSLVSAFLLRRPPGQDPERVAVVTSVDPGRSFEPDASPVSAPNYLAWREANQVFSDTAASDEDRSTNFATQGQPEALHSAAVTPNYFRVLGVSTQIGRTFVGGEDQPGRDHVVILSHDLWERRFGSDASVIGRSVRINRENFTVIGVMPASFHLLGFTPQLWTPLVVNAADQSVEARKNHSLYLFARLRAGVGIEQARAELTTLARRAEQNFPDTEKGWSVAVRTLPDFLIYAFSIRGALAVIMTTVGFVLLIACANVAGLLLARAAGRRKELAIRTTLGAGRLRIVRQLLTENLIIALLGGGLGLLLANWGIYFLRANLTFNEAISAVPLSLDHSVVVFAVVVSLGCAVLCGIAPAVNVSRTDVSTSLKDQSRGASASRLRSRLRTVMVTGEIALALFLLLGAGLLFRGLYVIEQQPIGFRPDHLLTANVTLDEARYKSAIQRTAFVSNLLLELKNIPGAEFVAISSDLPATGLGNVGLRIQGQPELPPGQGLLVHNVVVTSDYVQTAEIPLVRGRTFEETDSATSPRVVLVNQQFVNQYLREQEPLGWQIQLDGNSAAPEWSEIIGVVGNVKTYSEGTREEPQVYELFLQKPVASFALMLRSTADPNNLASAMREAVAHADPELPLDRVMSMAAVIERQRAGNPFFVTILGSFAVLALILAAIGIYGLVAYSVGQRTHEIGIRMALGAKTRDVLRMVLWDGVKMTVVGGAIGIALALPLPKLFDAIFFDLHVREPRLYFIVPALLLLVTMIATYIPARRASRVDPTLALHQD